MKLKTKFQDEDFDLGEVVDGVISECFGKHEKKLRVIATAAKGGKHTFYYSSIKKFMDDWEDASTEEVWFLGERIGNYSISKKESRKATEKILAWIRLKDKGFRFNGYDVAEPVGDGEFCGQVFFRGGNYSRDEIKADLNTIFEEDN